MPAASATGRPPTGITRTTRPVAGSIRLTLSFAASATQAAPAPAAIRVGSTLNLGVVAVTAFKVRSMRVTVPVLFTDAEADTVDRIDLGHR